MPINVVGIFLYLTKAHDVLKHNTLFDKINSYGIRGNMNLWFKSYLSNGSESVEMTQMECRNFTQYRYTASLRKIVQGVPQGSMLVPLFYVFQINDLPLNKQLVLSAADIPTNLLLTKILYAMKELELWFQKLILL
jgi:hypothetical protein